MRAIDWGELAGQVGMGVSGGACSGNACLRVCHWMQDLPVAQLDGNELPVISMAMLRCTRGWQSSTQNGDAVPLRSAGGGGLCLKTLLLSRESSTALQFQQGAPLHPPSLHVQSSLTSKKRMRHSKLGGQLLQPVLQPPARSHLARVIYQLALKIFSPLTLNSPLQSSLMRRSASSTASWALK